MVTIFKYLPLRDDTLLRPIARVFIRNTNKEWTLFRCLIDSGSDITLIPLSIGLSLGFIVNPHTIQEMGRVYGKLPVIYKSVTMQIGNKTFLCNIAWAMLDEVPPLLGRQDVFDQFVISFNQQKREIYFEG